MHTVIFMLDPPLFVIYYVDPGKQEFPFLLVALDRLRRRHDRDPLLDILAGDVA